MFSLDFLQIVILGALGWTGLGALILLVLLARDWWRGKLW